MTENGGMQYFAGLTCERGRLKMIIMIIINSNFIFVRNIGKNTPDHDNSPYIRMLTHYFDIFGFHSLLK